MLDIIVFKGAEKPGILLGTYVSPGGQ